MQSLAYMFENKEVTPTTWIDLQSDRSIITQFILPHLAILLSLRKAEYCFVFFDEAGQCSNPYRTFEEAQNALAKYVKHCL